MFYSQKLLEEYNKNKNIYIKSDEFDAEVFIEIITKTFEIINNEIKKLKKSKLVLEKKNVDLEKLLPYWFFSHEVWAMLKHQIMIYRQKYNINIINPNDLIENMLEERYACNIKTLKDEIVDKASQYQNFFLYFRMGIYGLELIVRQDKKNYNELIGIINKYQLMSIIDSLEKNINEIYENDKENKMLNFIYNYLVWIKSAMNEFIDVYNNNPMRLKTTKLDLFLDDNNDQKKQETKELVLNKKDEEQKLSLNHQTNLKLDFEKLKNLKEYFEKSIIGQPIVINKIHEILVSEMYNLGKASHRPIGVLFFVGPTGVGKTQTVKELAKFLYGTEQIHRFDMSEYKSEVAIQKLIGAPNGYVGYQEGGTLTNAMQKNPNTIVLFDEIEKADKNVFDLFLQLLDEGVVTSNKGVKSYFDNTIVVFTSNLGVSNLTARMGYENIAEIVKENVEYFFNHTINRPELLGRIGKDNIVVFDMIHKKDDLYKILDIQFKPFMEQYNKKKITLLYDRNELYDEILKGVDLSKGARDIRNKFELFKKHLYFAFFEKELDINNLKNKKIKISYNNNKIILELTPIK